MVELHCALCDAASRWDAGSRLRALQRLGHLRKVSDPASPLVDELFVSQSETIPCPNCRKASHLRINWIDLSDRAKQEDEAWGVRLCDACRQPIPAQRIAAIPNVKFCVACQQSETCATACDTISDESCPKCGAWLHWETRRSSLRTHSLKCRSCGHTAAS